MDLLMVGSTAPSHVCPGLAAIRELVTRRHRVRYVVGDRLAELVTRTGAEHVGYRSVLPDADTAWPEDLGEAMQLFLDEQKLVLPLLTSLDAPDAVLYDIGGFAGRVAACHWRVPAVQLSPTYVAWDGYEQDMAEFTAGLKASPSGAHYFAEVRDWLDENSMSIDADAFLGRPDACVVLIPRELQPNAERVDSRFVFTGPCVDMCRMTGWTPETDDARPLVYVALGTAYTDNLPIYRTSVEALGPSTASSSLPARSTHPDSVHCRRARTLRAHSRSSTYLRTPTCLSRTPGWAAPPNPCGLASRPSPFRRQSTSSPTPVCSRPPAPECTCPTSR